MSDDDRDIDIESDDDIDSDTPPPIRHTSTQNYTQAEKRAHHNALERKRRDHIKLSFTSLREAVPSLKGEKASRAQILKKTTECILTMRRKIEASKKDIEEIKRQNALLDAQIQVLENSSKGYVVDTSDFQQLANSSEVSSQQDSDEDEDFNQRKKMKTSFDD